MAIQAQFYPTNDVSPFCNNGFCAGGLVESCFNSQQKHQHQQQQQLEQRLQQLYSESQRPIDPNLLVYDPKLNNNHHLTSNSPSLAVQYEIQREQIDQYIRLQVRINSSGSCYVYYFVSTRLRLSFLIINFFSSWDRMRN